MILDYKVIELDIPPELMAAFMDPQIRRKINPIIESTLNQHAKDGWHLHVSGLSSMPTLVLERESKLKKGNKK